MQTKTLTPGDKVKITTREKEWTGFALESHDSEIILLKLSSGYNVGIRENKILNIKILEKSKPTKKEKPKLPKNKPLPNIALIITGGTISSRLDSKTGGVISTDVEEILTIAPEIKDICNIVKIEKPFLKMSEDMCPQDWKILAKVAEQLLNDKNINGIIITHGTDTLHYTASALSFFLGKLNKPVALTYSQRSIDRGSTDAHLNLICAAKYATSDIAEVALVGHKNTNDKFCIAIHGTKARKMHTSQRDTFKPINTTPLAEISKTEFKILKSFNPKNNKKVKTDTAFTEKVALIKIYPGQSPDILDFYESRNYKGIILELTGLGHLPTESAKYSWLAKIKKLIKNGIIICGVAQTLHGGLNPNVYSSGRKLRETGLIFLGDMLPETALVKLSWIAAHTSWDPKEKMLENISNEFNNNLKLQSHY